MKTRKLYTISISQTEQKGKNYFSYLNNILENHQSYHIQNMQEDILGGKMVNTIEEKKNLFRFSIVLNYCLIYCFQPPTLNTLDQDYTI